MSILSADSSGVVVASVAPWWVARVEAERPLRGVALSVADGVLVVDAVPVGVMVMDAAWIATGEALALAGEVDAALRVCLPSTTVDVSLEVLAGVAGGQGRRWWAERVDVAITRRGT